MKLVNQPKGSNCCGQCVIGMILGVSLEEAIVLVGTRGKTTTKHLVDALRNNGVQVSSRRKPSRGDGLPENAIVYARWPGSKNGHWLLNWKGKLLDPAKEWSEGQYVISSYLKLT